MELRKFASPIAESFAQVACGFSHIRSASPPLRNKLREDSLQFFSDALVTLAETEPPIAASLGLAKVWKDASKGTQSTLDGIRDFFIEVFTAPMDLSTSAHSIFQDFRAVGQEWYLAHPHK